MYKRQQTNESVEQNKPYFFNTKLQTHQHIVHEELEAVSNAMS